MKCLLMKCLSTKLHSTFNNYVKQFVQYRLRDTKKYSIPENWMFKEARELFLHPDVLDPLKLEIKWTDVDEEGLVDYMVKEKGFK